MKRLLCITANMNAGGAETFLMKIYRELDKSQYQMDFCVNARDNKYADEIEAMGGNIYYVPTKSDSIIKSFNAIKTIVKERNYRYVIRVNEHSLSVIDLIAAKVGGANVVAMRSSNSASETKKLAVLHKLFQFLPKTVPNVKMAPSRLAAYYTFGRKQVENGEVSILKNGLDIAKFKYSEKKRHMIRKEFCVESKFVIGHVGRFNTQKNHSFLLDIFKEIKAKNSNAVLLLVGDGILENEIKDKARNLGIERDCIFTGVRNDVNMLLCAMDVFLFPSLYEGMPNTVIEAQVTGLPCIVSNTITDECNITNLVEFVSLEDDAAKWASKVVCKHNNDRASAAKLMEVNGYEIKQVAKEFCQMIFE